MSVSFHCGICLLRRHHFRLCLNCCRTSIEALWPSTPVLRSDACTVGFSPALVKGMKNTSALLVLGLSMLTLTSVACAPKNFSTSSSVEAKAAGGGDGLPVTPTLPPVTTNPDDPTTPPPTPTGPTGGYTPSLFLKDTCIVTSVWFADDSILPDFQATSVSQCETFANAYWESAQVQEMTTLEVRYVTKEQLQTIITSIAGNTPVTATSQIDMMKFVAAVRAQTTPSQVLAGWLDQY